MRVWKAGVVNNTKVIELYPNINPGDIAFYLTKLEYQFSSFHCTALVLNLPKALGEKEIRLEIEVPNQMLSSQHSQPVFLCNQDPFWDRSARIHSKELGFFGICLYQNHLYCVETDSINKYSADEAVRLIKGKVAAEERELRKTRQELKLVEKLSTEKSEYNGRPIPQNVQLIVYAREDGRCAQCKSKHRIDFDYIIPLTAGGSITEDNIHILCQACRLKKPSNVTVLHYGST